ncbi:hypothetical protein CHL67_08350 [Prosthecochloris sp. GSB1]|uniref:radical SAM protein n=1 Tax=Prosthecochloris sp. GSB1 TaxID=281093 RepID=UPI000B8CC19B|nr:radical SAM protein [Prosthecochloris sp. GSB1]ASQ90926.1 hypothetical protein CHL67_08350 [Prosthecochloris sp. GSB1]
MSNNTVYPCRFNVPSSSSERLVVWEITNNCNLNCFHCCNNSGLNAGVNDEVSMETSIKVTHEFKDLNVTEVYFSGGEPLTRPDFLKILASIDPMLTKIYLASNGTTITEKVAEGLSKFNISGISISLDGHTAEMHSLVRGDLSCFDKTVEGIRLCVRKNLPFRVTSVITNDNANFIRDFLDLLLEIGVPSVVFQAIQGDSGRAAKHGNFVLDDTKKS